MEENRDKQKTLFGMPIVEVDIPEMKDNVIIFGDFSRWAAVIDIKPSNNAWGRLVQGLANFARHVVRYFKDEPPA